MGTRKSSALHPWREAGELRTIRDAVRVGRCVIEDRLRRDLKLDVLDELWANATMSEAKASELAVEAQHARQAPPTGIWCARSLTSTS